MQKGKSQSGVGDMGQSFFAADPSKAYFERFSLVWAPTSLTLFLVGLIGTGLYKHCGRDEYLVASVLGCVPGLVWPVLYPHPCDEGKPFAQRFWVKAAAWIAIFSFYGNYFWTHYFYTLLGAKYLFEAHRFNDVPIVCFICTYFYFTFYFSCVNVVLRWLSRMLNPLSSSQTRAMRVTGNVIWAGSVFVLSVLTAVFEAVSIQHFPLYTYSDTFLFMTVGSVFYGIYFMVGFPMFFALDEYTTQERKDPEEPSPVMLNPVVRPWKTGGNETPSMSSIETKTGVSAGSKQAMKGCTMWYAVQNALAAVAIVTLILDLWRLAIGDIYSLRTTGLAIPFISDSSRLATPAGSVDGLVQCAQDVLK